MDIIKPKDDVQQLINQGVYRATTSEINDDETLTVSTSSLFHTKKSFEGRGLINVIASTVIVTILLFTFLFIHVEYTSSIFADDETISKPMGDLKEDLSSWTTSYDLPQEIPLLELHPTTFNFDSPCPGEKFALVLYLDSPISVFQDWMTNCGSQVAYFRMNGDPEIEDVDKIIKFVPNAQYLPIRANLYVSKTDDNMLNDPDFQNRVEFEGNIVNSLVISGYLTSPMLKSVLKISPFVEALTIKGTEVCSSLVRPLRLGMDLCQVAWPELRSLKIYGTGDCVRTFEYIDMCWKMDRLDSLDIKRSYFNNINIKYVEDIIDRYRVIDSTFEQNVCTEDTQITHEYVCRDQ